MSPLPIVRCASAMGTDSLNGLSPQNWGCLFELRSFRRHQEHFVAVALAAGVGEGLQSVPVRLQKRQAHLTAAMRARDGGGFEPGAARCRMTNLHRTFP
jgi:hypothetical protein